LPKNRKKNSPRPVVEEPYIKDFLDMVAPSVIDFKVDHYLCGNTCRCVWALREYPTSTDEQAILRHLGEMDGVTIRIYTRQVTPSEERRIIHNAANKHRMSRSSTEDLQQTVTAEANLQDVVTLVSSMHRNREPLLHCAVFLELTAPDYDALKLLQTDVLTELVRSKLNVDRLMLRQQEGFVSVMPAGRNAFGAQFERVLPASSVANLYPFNYSGKTDPHGFYIGKDKYGANILVDFDKRDDDKTSANILILGNSGQGKSYLLKLLLLNFLEAGKSVISLDVEHEQKDMCETVGGCFMDLMGGVYRINPLEPKCWDDGSGPEDRDAPEAFRKSTRLSQHISFLKDFFRAYKDFSDRHIDAIEIMVGKLYAKWGISDSTNFAGLKPQDYPILSDLYELIEQEYKEYDGNCHQLYTAELLQEILLGLHSMCQGAEAQFFNGHTNVTSSRFIVFGVKGLLQASKNVRGAMLFNILSYMSDRLLTIGNTTATLDELYVWLSDNVSVGTTIIEYIRNTLKRVRKKDSNLIMASQNLEDFDREGIRELTKPLFAIPPHQFIFNCGSIDKRFYMDLLQLEEAEYNLIRFPQRGVCLFKCGNERYLLEVHAPTYKEALFGTAGGR
jgi:type IV secretory pathway VirB4 component